MAGIRNNGSYPCHRCLIPKTDLDKLGAPNDTERVQKMRCESEQAALVHQAKQTIEEGFAFDGKKVEVDLFPQSLTATQVCLCCDVSHFWQS